MPVANDMPEFKDFFSEDSSVEKGKIKEFKVGDIVKFVSAFSFMRKKYSEELWVFCIIEYPNESGVGVVVGEKVGERWMVYNGEKEKCQSSSNPNSSDWDFWEGGPRSFDSHCFEKV